MNTKYVGYALFTAYLALAITDRVLGQNLIVNGGFESGLTGWYGSYGIINSTPNTIDGTHVGVILDIGSSSGHQTLSQTISTTPGLTYLLQFDMRLPELDANGHPILGNSNGGSTTISVNWNGLTLESIPVTSRSWTLYDIQVAADESSTVLNFYNPSIAAWPFIDGVSVAPAPEPDICSLSSMALFVIVLWAICRKDSSKELYNPSNMRTGCAASRKTRTS